MIPLLSRLFPARSALTRDRDRWLRIATMWAARAGELAAQNRCQRENVGEGLRQVDALRAALNEIVTHTDPDKMRVIAYGALGHEPQQ